MGGDCEEGREEGRHEKVSAAAADRSRRGRLGGVERRAGLGGARSRPAGYGRPPRLRLPQRHEDAGAVRVGVVGGTPRGAACRGSGTSGSNDGSRAAQPSGGTADRGTRRRVTRPCPAALRVGRGDACGGGDSRRRDRQAAGRGPGAGGAGLRAHGALPRRGGCLRRPGRRVPRHRGDHSGHRSGGGGSVAWLLTRTRRICSP